MLQQDPNLAAPHAARAYFKLFYEWDWAGAEQEGRRAIELDPNNPQTYTILSYLHTALGQFDAVRTAIGKALQLDPRDDVIAVSAGLPWYYAREYDRALEAFVSVNQTSQKFWWGHVWEGHTPEQIGRSAEALAAYLKANALEDNGPRSGTRCVPMNDFKH